jgi:hypothetical protein
MSTFSSHISRIMSRYKIHVLIFLAVLSIGITFAHPSLFITDEWVTVNQLAQLHEGHQVILNEGKYGNLENGTLSSYFITKNNYLGYSLFLPIISLPAYWLVDLLGEHFVFFILYLWTLLLIAIALFLDRFLKNFTRIGNWRWTTGLIIAAFVLLFINFRYYLPFVVTGIDSYPEIMAIVFTNILLFAVLAVLIFEINLTIFNNTVFSSFGSLICICCSSYLFWANNCKDHILTAFIFIIVVLMIVKYQKTNAIWYIRTAFFASGLLAWARPELALTICGALCLFTGFILFLRKGEIRLRTDFIPFLVSPLFTLAGAIPFFINNYLVTGNPLLVPFILWNKDISTMATTNAIQQTPNATFQPLFNIFQASTNLQPSTFLPDIYGIFFSPQSGSLGVFMITPVFLIAMLLIPILFIRKEFQFSYEEKMFMGTMGLLGLAVFLTYVRGLSGMNTSIGITPDIRYLSPLYLPLNLLGLMILKKTRIIGGNEVKIVKWIITIWVFSIPASLMVMSRWYPYPDSHGTLYTLLNGFDTILLLIMLIFLVIGIYGHEFFQTSPVLPLTLIAAICAIPYIWQIDATFLMRWFGSGLGGYSFWIPAVRMFFAGIFG